MEAANRVWYDLRESKHAICYLTHYLAKSKDNAKTFKIVLIVISALGTFSSFITAWFAVAGCAIILLAQILNELKFFFIVDEHTIEKIGNLKLLYVKQFNEVTQLWSDYKSNKISIDNLSKKHAELIPLVEEIERIDNSVRIKTNLKLHEKSSIDTDNYLKEIYYY